MDNTLLVRFIDWAWRRGRWPWLVPIFGIQGWFWLVKGYSELSFAGVLRNPWFLWASIVLAVAPFLLYFGFTRPRALPLPQDMLAVGIARFVPVSAAAKDDARNIASRIEQALTERQSSGAPLVVRRAEADVTGADESERHRGATKLATRREVNVHALIWGEVRRDGPQLFVAPHLSMARQLGGVSIDERALPTLKSAEPNQLDLKERHSKDIAAFLAGLAWRKRGDLDRAIAAFGQAQLPECLLYAGLTHYERGQRSGHPQPHLRAAMGAYRAALDMYSRAGIPLDSAMTQNNLGIALAELGRRASEEQRSRLLGEAVEAFRAALGVYTRVGAPHDSARVQNNLGIALGELGRQASGEDRSRLLGEAVEAFRASLRLCTHRKFRQQSAATQNNLGTALGDLGIGASGEEGNKLLRAAVDAFRAARKGYNLRRFPRQWAGTQSNLGEALTELGRRTDGKEGTRLLRKAVGALRAAIEVPTLREFPLEWATTQHNLGDALSDLADKIAVSEKTQLFQEALACFDSALSVYDAAQFPELHAQVAASKSRVAELLGSGRRHEPRNQ